MKFKLILTLLLVITLNDFASGRIINNSNKGTSKLARRNVTTILGSSSSGPAAIRQEVDDDYDENDIIVSDDIPNDDVVEATEASLSNEVSDIVSSVGVDIVTEIPVNTNDANPINRYCKCTQYECNCCRDFSLPLVPIKGPGCATIQYLSGDRMSVGIKFGDRLITQRVISGRRAKPVCVPLPGGFNRFCGRIYGISKREEDFKACLGLELRADNEVEAVLRVSCFEFGPRGLAVSDAEPLPPPIDDVEEEDDDDDDDILGGVFGDEDDDAEDDDDDEDDEDDEVESDDADTDDDADTGAVGEADYTGFSLLDGDVLEELLGTDTNKKKVKKPSIANRNAPVIISSENLTLNDANKNPNSNNETSLAQNPKDESSEDLLDVVEALVSEDDDDDDDENDDDDEEDDGNNENDEDNELDEKDDDSEKLGEDKEDVKGDYSNKKDEHYDEQNLVSDEADDDDEDDSVEDGVGSLVEEDDDDDDDDDDSEEKDEHNGLENEVDSASNLSKERPSFFNKLSNLSRFFKIFNNKNNNINNDKQ